MFTVNCNGKLLCLHTPLVMGIINVTPDSFYAGSREQATGLVARAKAMLDEGADIIDIGGQSTRPGSERISAEKELERVFPAVKAITENFPGTIISVDTYHAAVAERSVNSGASIINDISAGNMDKDMIPVVAGLQVPYICMHMKGSPESMQENPSFENVTREVLDFFILKVEECRRAGINDLIIDPGFGFGKNIHHNFILLRELSVFNILQRPILAGLSRKSTIYKTLGITSEDSLNGSTVLHTLALHNGASILRVHDVKEAKQAVTLFQKYQEA